ncbi:MAG: M14 family metallopeptidase [Elusimicrobia bacterium]|nr:M14 family metallopeptidase [Elusimicrobiota bacterium]
MDSRVLKLAPLALLTVMPAHSTEKRLSTRAEQTQWVETGRYEEVVRLCRGFEQHYPKKVRCLRFGTTPEGRPMLALAASEDGRLDPKSNRTRKRPVLLFQGGIHSGEIDGKDAGFLLLRRLLNGEVLPRILRKVTLVFVPIFNIDGHERFGPNNRPNQIGPKEMGWRTTAENLNLNRDYMKADAPEMRAMLKLLGEWDPILYADLHVTDGADFQHDVAVLIEPSLSGPEPLRRAGRELSAELMRMLSAQGHKPLSFYPTFIEGDNPASGIALSVMPPRFSHAYWALRGRIGVLVETHSWKDYETRVRATYDVMLDLLELAGRQGPSWLATARKADEEASLLRGRELVLEYAPTGSSRTIEFLGYEYERKPSEISGKTWIIYDPKKPQVWRIPLFDALKPSLTVKAPGGGYVVPPAYAGWISAILEAHGISYRTIKQKSPPPGQVEVFRAPEVHFAKESFEGRWPVSVKGEWKAEQRSIPEGSLYIPVSQPKAALVLHLLEPTAPDSFLSWGFFNPIFERKEYMDDYVLEKEARLMLEKNPALKREFEGRLARDPDFAKSPAERLDFFYRRHPAWDERLSLYPVYRWQTGQ